MIDKLALDLDACYGDACALCGRGIVDGKNNFRFHGSIPSPLSFHLMCMMQLMYAARAMMDEHGIQIMSGPTPMWGTGD